MQISSNSKNNTESTIVFGSYKTNFSYSHFGQKAPDPLLNTHIVQIQYLPVIGHKHDFLKNISPALHRLKFIIPVAQR